jgi:hypothetical protein
MKKQMSNLSESAVLIILNNLCAKASSVILLELPEVHDASRNESGARGFSLFFSLGIIVILPLDCSLNPLNYRFPFLLTTWHTARSCS